MYYPVLFSLIAATLLASFVAGQTVVVGHEDLSYPKGVWQDSQHDVFCDGGAHVANESGAEVALQFNGTYIAVYLASTSLGASYEILIDTVFYYRGSTVRRDFVCSPTTPFHEIKYLSKGMHNLTIVTLDDGMFIVSKILYNSDTVPERTISDFPMPPFTSILASLRSTSGGITQTTAQATTPLQSSSAHHSISRVTIAVIASCLTGLLLAAIIGFLRYRRLQQRYATSQKAGQWMYDPKIVKEENHGEAPTSPTHFQLKEIEPARTSYR